MSKRSRCPPRQQFSRPLLSRVNICPILEYCPSRKKVFKMCRLVVRLILILGHFFLFRMLLTITFWRPWQPHACTRPSFLTTRLCRTMLATLAEEDLTHSLHASRSLKASATKVGGSVYALEPHVDKPTFSPAFCSRTTGATNKSIRNCLPTISQREAQKFFT